VLNKKPGIGCAYEASNATIWSANDDWLWRKKVSVGRIALSGTDSEACTDTQKDSGSTVLFDTRRYILNPLSINHGFS
jgi:hypothetical protein